MADENFTPDGFNEPRPGKPWRKSMFWLFIVVGIFIVCLLIWMFIALSDNAVDKDLIPEQQIENTEPVTDSLPQPADSIYIEQPQQ